jgi:hypothetical protein
VHAWTRVVEHASVVFHSCASEGSLPLPCGPAGGRGDWGLYQAAGPYLTRVTVLLDYHWVVVDTPVAVETVAEIVNVINITEGSVNVINITEGECQRHQHYGG